MTSEEAKQWIDDNMSEGGSWNDATSLTALVDKTVIDTTTAIVEQLEVFAKEWEGTRGADKLRIAANRIAGGLGK
jgi:hypothetical protein